MLVAVGATEAGPSSNHRDGHGMPGDSVAFDIGDSNHERIGQRLSHNPGLALAGYPGDSRRIHRGPRFEIAVSTPKRGGSEEQNQKLSTNFKPAQDTPSRTQATPNWWRAPYNFWFVGRTQELARAARNVQVSITLHVIQPEDRRIISTWGPVRQRQMQALSHLGSCPLSIER